MNTQLLNIGPSAPDAALGAPAGAAGRLPAASQPSKPPAMFHVAALTHVPTVGLACVEDAIAPVGGLLTCKPSDEQSKQYAQVGRTHRVSISGSDANEFGMTTALGAFERTVARVNGVPPRGRPV